ncbi:hypothetical protein [Salegentibacter sp. 24]|uniref:hypothetical protein n=1 Tax=Salegentibacter sp. 24 TaxID=2183986 RepID=UPI00105F789B|nr:hypothetical protein [Salegentibacter sp. 24]
MKNSTKTIENRQKFLWEVLTEITDRISHIKAWLNRPLEKFFCIEWLDAMHYKVKVNGKNHIALYNIPGI